ncbi:hypothetical protein DFP72DRAFT_1081509 [Ephemerocybe angulata]|uniref:Uncharacterized protein n=1 Tax=Ephemerocybe angulata TaxID=980116 RepID=A0A8H6LUJ5_9AGAR|nr:hypothetical protein DFP72DRAFT_1081509 [Tulosesus angulatus]
MGRTHPSTYRKIHECLVMGSFNVQHSLEVSFSDYSSPGHINLDWSVVSSWVGLRRLEMHGFIHEIDSRDFTDCLTSLINLTYLKVDLVTHSHEEDNPGDLTYMDWLCDITAKRSRPSIVFQWMGGVTVTR